MKDRPCPDLTEHRAHTWWQANTATYRCPGRHDRPTLPDACERLAGHLHAQRHLRMVLVPRDDLAALLAAVGWNVTADEARDTPEPEPQQEVLL